METNELMTETAISTEEAVASEETAETASQPQGAGDAVSDEAESNANDAENAPTEEGLTIRYLKEDIPLSKEQAKNYAEMGKHYEDKVKPMLDDLDYVATLKGMTVKDLVKSLIDSDESDYREELVAQFGEDSDVVKDMLELRRQKNRKAYDEAVTNRNAAEKQAEEEAQKSATAKLAEQFEAVRELFPAYDTVEKVPDAVIKAALKSGDLEKELLRFELSERNKTDAAKATSEKNKKENVGSVASDNTDDGLSSAFIRGLWG